MKIALAGSGSTGKSTLAEAASKQFDIPYIPEYAREVAQEMGIGNIRELTPETTYDFQINILDKKITEEDRHETFIADRSSADNAAYYFRWCCRDVPDEKNKTYIERCFERLKEYDKIIVLPWNGIPLQDDGFRSKKLYYQYEIHCLILGILADQKIDYEILEEKTLEGRLKYLEKYFRKDSHETP